MATLMPGDGHQQKVAADGFVARPVPLDSIGKQAVEVVRVASSSFVYETCFKNHKSNDLKRFDADPPAIPRTPAELTCR